MLRNRSHGIVRDARRHGATHPSGVCEERVKATVTTLTTSCQRELCARQQEKSETYVIKINVGSAIMRQHKVTNGIRALDRVFVAVESVEEPRVLIGDEITSFLVRPKLKRKRGCVS